VALENNGSRGYTSFVLLVIELQIIVWVGWWTERNAGGQFI
jgi:H+-transporting ATPase